MSVDKNYRKFSRQHRPVYGLHTWRFRYGAMIDRGFEYKLV